jgi:tripartite-type tricarboxylate transporter receptor subunit TctC
MASGWAWAQSAPVTKILVGFPAGGGTDTIARILGESLQHGVSPHYLGQRLPAEMSRESRAAVEQGGMEISAGPLPS